MRTSKKRFKPSHYNLKQADQGTHRSRAIKAAVLKAILKIETNKGKMAMKFHRHFTNSELYWLLRELTNIAVEKEGHRKAGRDDIRRAIRFLARYRPIDRAWLKIGKCDENGRPIRTFTNTGSEQ